MSTVVEVRLVPALVPTPRRELPAVGPAGRAPSGPSGSAVAPVAPTLPDRPGATPTPTPPGVDGADGARTRPVRVRGEEPDLLAACLPVPERLGAATLAAYRHGLPDVVDAAPDEDRGSERARRRASALPRGLATGAVNPLDPRQACCMVALAAVEVLTGTRPIAQLARWVTPAVYDALARRAALTAPRSRVLDPAAVPRDLRDADPAAWSRRPAVRRVRACPVDEHTLEASVVVAHADRVRAVALRLTREAGRWRASALVVG